MTLTLLIFFILAGVSAARLVWKVRIAWKRQQAFERETPHRKAYREITGRELVEVLANCPALAEWLAALDKNADQCDAALREMNDQ